MPATDPWDEFQAVFNPLLEELVLLTIALARIAAACDSLRIRYRDFDEWIYNFRAKGGE